MAERRAPKRTAKVCLPFILSVAISRILLICKTITDSRPMETLKAMVSG